MCRIVLVALVLSACSSTAPTTYRQAAGPMAPPFSAMESAPHTLGQPGYLSPEQDVPRSPHTRYLPPTKEPGLWAGDGPKAVHEPASVEVLGITIPLPSFDEDPSLNYLSAIECTDRLETAVMDTKSLDVLARKLIPRERYCASALAFSRCMADLRATLPDEAGRRGADAAIKDVLKFIEQVCPGGGRTSRSEDFAGRAAAKARTTKGGTAH